MLSFTCNAATFANAFNTVGRVVASKNGRTGLQSVLVDLKDGVMTLTGTDLEQIIVQEIEVEGEDGVALLPKDKIGDILKSLDSNDEITIKEKDQKVVVVSGSARWNCNAEDPKIFPFTERPSGGTLAIVSASDFENMVSRTIFASDATKKSSGAMSGILVEHIDGVIGFTATDGRRLCHQEFKTKNEEKAADFTGIFTPDVLRTAMSILGNEDVKILGNRDSAWIQIGKTDVFSRNVEGMFPKWRQFKPKCSGSFGVIVKPFLKAINQAAIMKNESSNAVTFDFSENRVLIYGSQESGNSSIPCEVGWSDEDASFKIDPMFVTDCLKPLGAETLNIQVEDRGMAWVVETDGFYGVMIPIGDQK